MSTRLARLLGLRCWLVIPMGSAGASELIDAALATTYLKSLRGLQVDVSYRVVLMGIGDASLLSSSAPQP